MTMTDAASSVPSEENAYHAIPLEELLRVLRVDPTTGLPQDEVRTRLAQYGPNSIPKVKGSFWKVYLAPILNWLINIYLVSSFALVIIAWLFPMLEATSENPMAQAGFWLSIVAVNCLVAIFQQFRAQKKLEALEKLSAGEARVLRDGVEKKVNPEEIVPGDIVKLEQGDRIPADARIITATNLTTNEASLTGESVPSVKDGSAVVAPDAALSDRANMVFFGTYVSTGTATVVVVVTGGRTEIGKIQGELESLNTGDIPLRKKVNLLAKYLGIAALILLFTSFLWVVVFGPLLHGEPLDLDTTVIAWRMSQAITSAMMIMPINIPLLTTIVLLTGVLAMAREGVIIRDLSAVESLGRVSVICSDKTGTMTRNQMTVKFCWDTENLYYITGDGYEPKGEIFRLKEPSVLDKVDATDRVRVTDVLGWKGLYRLITSGGINNDAELTVRDIPGQGTVWMPIGDPTDAALLTLFRKSGLDEQELRGRFKVVKEFPFDSELKRMSKVCEDGDEFIAFVKGATEVILPRCTMKNAPGRPVPLTSDDIAEIEALSTAFAAKGYRVISVAYRQLRRVPEGPSARDVVENDLVYLGFTCLVDPPREGVREAVNACHSAGIEVVMITGDAAATAKTIARDLNILDEDSLVVEGSQIESLSEEDFARVNVFARVNPAHKQVIVERYQRLEKVVAMTGDGVNDALALAMSDAGIAMGITGTDVAKEAADLVITDDSFASIVTGVHQGRGLFSKIRNMIYFYVSINLFESILFFGALFLLPPYFVFLETWQKLYLVGTSHVFPGLALVFDKTSPHAMEEKPRDSEEIITRPIAEFMALHVVLMAAGAATVYFLTLTGFMGIVDIYPGNLTGYYGGMVDARMKAAVMLLTVILLVESWVVLIIRRMNMPMSKALREPGYRLYVVLIGLIYVAHLLLMYVPLVQAILAVYGLEFFFVPLTLWDWTVCIVAVVPVVIGMEAYKKYLRSRDVTL